MIGIRGVNYVACARYAEQAEVVGSSDFIKGQLNLRARDCRWIYSSGWETIFACKALVAASDEQCAVVLIVECGD